MDEELHQTGDYLKACDARIETGDAEFALAEAERALQRWQQQEE